MALIADVLKTFKKSLIAIYKLLKTEKLLLKLDNL